MTGSASAALAEDLNAEEQAVLEADRNAGKAADAGNEAGTETEAPAAEHATTGDAPATDGQQPQRTVPHQALHEERQRRQEIERQLAEERQRGRQLEERTNLLLQRIGQPAQPAAPAQPVLPAVPPLEQDPVGHLAGRLQQQGAVLAEVVQALAGQRRASEATAGVDALRMRAAALENEFAAANPDYAEASAHLFNARRRELAAAGWTDPAEIQTMLANEAMGLAVRAMQQGKNPAAVAMDLAKLRGWAPAAAGNGNGTTGANGAAAAGAPSEADRMRTIERGQRESRSLGNLPGRSPQPPSAARIASMSDGEFNDFLAKASLEQLQEAFGG